MMLTDIEDCTSHPSNDGCNSRNVELQPASCVETITAFFLRRKQRQNPVAFSVRTILALGSVLVASFFPALQAESLNDQTRRAAELNDQGNFKEALKLLAPLLQSQGQNNDPAFGKIWNVYGSALLSTGYEDGARRSYERAIEILRKTPTEKQDLAAAFDNLGALKAEMGQLGEANLLGMKARDLFETVGDRSGVARTSINLALFALRQGKRRRMHKLLKEAFSAEDEVANPTPGDLSALYGAQALERNSVGDTRGALASIDKAMQLWTEHYGPRYFMLASCYSLRAQLETALNDRERALTDYRHSLEILKLHGDLPSRNYFLVEAAYARSLRQFGMREDAEQMEHASQYGLNSLRTPCAACTLSANSLR